MTDNEHDDVAAAYYATLQTFDELPSYNKRALLLMNFAKYVLMEEAEARNPLEAHPTNADMVETFTRLTNTLCANVLDLIPAYLEHLGAPHACGKCDMCRAAGIQAPVGAN